jgi:hypothetical protein
MIRLVRWPFAVACFALGLYLLRLSYDAYTKWKELLDLGDPSGAEIYEVEFWPEVSVGLFLIVTCAFLVGRWSVIKSTK